MSREWLQRRRMLLAWLLIALLVLVLVLREGLGYWREQAQWRALAESAAGMRSGPALTLERLRQSAQARHIELAEVQVQDQGWQARGKVADAQALQDWLQALHLEGAHMAQWGLSAKALGCASMCRCSLESARGWLAGAGVLPEFAGRAAGGLAGVAERVTGTGRGGQPVARASDALGGGWPLALGTATVASGCAGVVGISGAGVAVACPWLALALASRGRGAGAQPSVAQNYRFAGQWQGALHLQGSGRRCSEAQGRIEVNDLALAEPWSLGLGQGGIEMNCADGWHVSGYLAQDGQHRLAVEGDLLARRAQVNIDVQPDAALTPVLRGVQWLGAEALQGQREIRW